MRNRGKRSGALRLAAMLCLAAALGAMGCATNTAPRGWLDEPDEYLSSAYGGWIEIRYTHSSGGPADVSGELIAVDADSVYVGLAQLAAVSRPDIAGATLFAYHAGTGGIAGLTLLGALSTFSTGMYFVFGMPVWIAGGVAAGSTRTRDPMLSFPAVSLDELAPFARFPHGLPACVDRSAIRGKPAQHPGRGG